MHTSMCFHRCIDILQNGHIFNILLMLWTIWKRQIMNSELSWCECTKFHEHMRRVSCLFFFLRVAFTQCHAPHNHIILLADRLHLCRTSTASTTSLLFPSNCGRIVGVSRGLLVSLTRVSRSHSTFKWLHVYSVHVHSFSCTKVSVFFVFTEPSIKAIYILSCWLKCC